MIIEITGLYGRSEKERGYYRRNNLGFYDFVCHKGLATVLTKEEADAILANKDQFIKKYKAKNLRAIL
ncbi:MAG: hypothetical protein II399_08395 [Lachnospiraceae bacterium]|nr:hypothetical protein [Lachnospiraceae bacterium]